MSLSSRTTIDNKSIIKWLAKINHATNARSQLLHRLFAFREVKEAHVRSIQENIRRVEKEIVSIEKSMSLFGFEDGFSWSMNCCFCKHCSILVILRQPEGVRECVIQQRRTFSYFMSLPYEIRLQIWDMSEITIQPAKTIDLWMRSDPAGTKYDQEGNLMCQIGANAPHVGLRVCYETRALLLSKVFISGTTRIYLNPSIDTVYFSPKVSWGQVHRFPQFAAEKDLMLLRHLAFEETLLAPFMLACASSSVGLATLEHLETIWITLAEGGRWSWDHERWRINIEFNNPHCSKCESMTTQKLAGRWKAWRFPTLRKFASDRGLSGDVAEEAYFEVLSGWEGRYSLFAWLWDDIHCNI